MKNWKEHTMKNFVKSQVAAHPFLSLLAVVGMVISMNYIIMFMVVCSSVSISMAQVLMDQELGRGANADAQLQLKFNPAPAGSRERKIRDAFLYARLHNNETAYTLWKQVTAMPAQKNANPHTSYFIELADAFAKNHETEKATSVFEDLLTRYPDDPEVCAHYAAWLNRWGYPEDAVTLMEIVIKSEAKIRVPDAIPYIQYLHRAGEEQKALAVAKEVITESAPCWKNEVAKIRSEVAAIEHTIARK